MHVTGRRAQLYAASPEIPRGELQVIIYGEALGMWEGLNKILLACKQFLRNASKWVVILIIDNSNRSLL